MTAITELTDFWINHGLPNAGLKTLVVSCIDTVDNSDTLEVDLTKYGCGAVLGVIGFTHTTENSVVIQEQPTTTMSGLTLTITVGGSSSDQVRHYLLFCASTENP